jgi:glycosyltransferase involved in cell wall biosynthesis
MKTAFIAYSLKNSSVAEFFTCIANRLADTYEVIIITYQNEVHQLDIDERIRILEWPSSRPTKLHDFRFLNRLMKVHRPEIMISNFAAVNLFMLTGYLYRVKNRICWYHTHSSAHLSENKLHLIRKMFIYRLATKIITTSQSAKKDISSHYRLNENKIEVIPNAVKNSEFINLNKKKFKLIYVGRLHPVKGFDVLLKSLPFVVSKYPNLEISVIGGGSDEISNYKGEAKSLGIDSVINFRGFIAKEKVMKELAESYLCIVPSYFEAFCYVVIESFSVKTPVVGSNTSGIAEIIEDDCSGLMFEPGNHNMLAEKILRILDNSDFHKLIAENAYERFQNFYELEATISMFLNQCEL